VKRSDLHPASACRRIVAATLWKSAIVALLLAGTAVSIAQQGDRPQTEALARRATERLQALQQEADQLASQERTLLNDLRRLELERQIKLESLKGVSADADKVASELAATSDRILQLEQQDLAERPDVRARLVEIYKLGRARYLRLLLSTPDLRQLGRASRMVAALAQVDRNQLASHQRTLDSLKAARVELEERSRQMQSVRAEAARAEAAAAVAARAQAAVVRDIDLQRDLNAQLAGELQAAQQKLQVTLHDLPAGAGGDPALLPLRPFKGALDWPAAGSIRRRFGAAAGQASAGIEIAAEEGAPVHAIHEGVVAFADPFSGFGKLVIVDHGSQTFSLYGDLLEIEAKRGSRVERGQSIGSVGTSPAGTSGLYFELRVDGRAVDPLQWLKKP
jgi:septal ring factor EnvC (AmiA/AmiB activator)